MTPAAIITLATILHAAYIVPVLFAGVGLGEAWRVLRRK